MKRAEKQRMKQQKAEELADARAKRTDEQQLAKLDAGGYRAAKERVRLQARIDRKKRISKKGKSNGKENTKA